jgi:hypothetical protein
MGADAPGTFPSINAFRTGPDAYQTADGHIYDPTMPMNIVSAADHDRAVKQYTELLNQLAAQDKADEFVPTPPRPMSEEDAAYSGVVNGVLLGWMLATPQHLAKMASKLRLPGLPIVFPFFAPDFSTLPACVLSVALNPNYDCFVPASEEL